MRAQSPDTHSDAERMLITIARQATPAEKFSQVEMLSRVTTQLPRRHCQSQNTPLTRVVFCIHTLFHLFLALSMR